MNTSKIKRLAALAAVTLTAACTPRAAHKTPVAPSQTPDEPAVLLKTYKVPNDLGPKLRPVLSRVFKKGQSDRVAQVALAPGGQLVVVAPPGIHRGVESLIKDLAGVKAATPIPTIEMTYWVVVGREGLNADGDPCGKQGFACMGGDKDLIATLKQVLPNAHPGGQMRVALLEKLSVKTRENDSGTIQGHSTHIRQMTNMNGDKIVADVRAAIERRNVDTGVINTRLQLDPTKTIVLGQAGLRFKGEQNGGMGTEAVLLLVIRGAVQS